MSQISVLIHGGGPAGLTAARLLGDSGFAVRLRQAGSSAGPTLLLNPGTVHLLHELWGMPLHEIPHRHRVEYREVHPPGQDPVVLQQHGLVVDSRMLSRYLYARLQQHYPEIDENSQGALWHLLAQGRMQTASEAFSTYQSQPFGMARCSMVEIVPSAHYQPDRAVFEALENGWLFLLPLGPQQALLQALVEQPDGQGELISAQLSASRQVVKRIGAIQQEPRTYAAMPRLADPVYGDHWVALGDAAMALPPVTGDGVGNGLRTAILLTAALRAIRRGEPVDAVLRHYQQRLRQAFYKVTQQTGHTDEQPVEDAGWYRLQGLDLVGC